MAAKHKEPAKEESAAGELAAAEQPQAAPPEEPKAPATQPWLVWVLVPCPAKKSRMVVDATGKGDAWAKFCEANGVPTTMPGGRVIRPALATEIPTK